MELNISRNDMVLAFSEALDLLDSKLYYHHLTVAYIALGITDYLSITDEDLSDLIMAALLQDIGLFKREERNTMAQFDDKNLPQHTRTGYLLICQYTSFRSIAKLVLHHHTPYNSNHPGASLSSHLLFMADRISGLLDHSKPLLIQKDFVLNKIQEERGKRFMPILCDGFQKLAHIDAFWMSIESRRMRDSIKNALKIDYRIQSIEELLQIGKLFITAIDYRSRYTAAHSIGVSKVSRMLAQFASVPERDQAVIEVAGYFHDIGKIAISKSILDKPDKLTDEEYAIIKSHAFYTYEILNKISGFEVIAQIAAYHHEKLDGTGYPYHLAGSHLMDYARIMGVADLFSALTERRPYRKNLTKSEIVEILLDLVVKGAIDNRYVDLTIRNFDALYEENASFQKLAYNDFDLFEENMQIDHYLFLQRLK